MGSGFTPSGIFDTRLGELAAVLAETDAYVDFVGEEVASLGVPGMYFHGIDRRELQDNEEDFPEAFVIWQLGDDFERYSLQAGGAPYHMRGGVELIIEANTPAEYLRNTPAAMNWIWGIAQGMVAEMETLFGRVNDSGMQRPEIRSIRLAAAPYRESEGATEDAEGVNFDYVGVAVRFEYRN